MAAQDTRYIPTGETYWELNGNPGKAMSIDELRTCLLSFVKLIDSKALDRIDSDEGYRTVLQNTSEPIRNMARMLGLKKAHFAPDHYEKLTWSLAWEDPIKRPK